MTFFAMSTPNPAKRAAIWYDGCCCCPSEKNEDVDNDGKTKPYGEYEDTLEEQAGKKPKLDGDGPSKPPCKWNDYNQRLMRSLQRRREGKGLSDEQLAQLQMLEECFVQWHEWNDGKKQRSRLPRRQTSRKVDFPLTRGMMEVVDFADRAAEIIRRNNIYEDEIDEWDTAPIVRQAVSPGVPLTPAYRSGGEGGVEGVNAMSALTLTIGDTVNHGIYGNTPPLSWDGTSWDGSSPPDFCSLTISQLCSWAFPSAGHMRGLRELYLSTQPFANELLPTVYEIEQWNLKVINHLRALFGLTAFATLSKKQFLRAQWANERRYTTVWDSAYPTGTCVGSTDPHCGFTFQPSCADQVPYLDGAECVPVETNYVEGVIWVPTWMPWATKMAYILENVICNEGRESHGGPFFFGAELGMAWHVEKAATSPWGVDDTLSNVRLESSGGVLICG
jgi:hypothetical protein